MTTGKNEPKPIAWTDVNSTQIASIAYDDAARELRVRFKKGATYVYYDVTADTVKALKEAKSVGRYFGENVRGQFRHSIVEDAA